MKKVASIILLAITGLMSCTTDNLVDPDLDFDEFNGTFEVNVTGDESRKIQGEAYFLHGIIKSGNFDENGSTLTITLTNDQNEDEVISISLVEEGNAGGIKTGTYTIEVDLEEKEGVWVQVGAYFDSSLTAYLSEEGTIKMDKVGADRVEGSLDVRLNNLNGLIISISGTFKASGITTSL
jgi:hypothetical protein